MASNPLSSLGSAPNPDPSSNTDPASTQPLSEVQETSRTAEMQLYNDLRRLIPSLASELDGLRTALREHNRWIQRYGHTSSGPSSSSSPPPPLDPTPPPPPRSTSTSTPNPPSASPQNALPPYSAPDVPPYTEPQSTTQEVMERRDQIIEWLREGEDVLREYSARFAQVGADLGMEGEDVLGTWNTEGGGGENALPDYERVGRDEDMVGGVGEVPPPYLRDGGKGGEE